MSNGPVVMKVGGSLYDLPDLGQRLRRWLERLDARHTLIVPGGGPTADVIREMDRVHLLGEEAAHWLALRSLSLNAYVLQRLLPEARIVTDPEDLLQPQENWAIVDAHAFAAWDEGRPGCLPHTWDATSDAVAARVAVVCGARRLFLLKSVAVPEGTDWHTAAKRGHVDPVFPRVLAQGREMIEVTAVSFRDDT
jgi:aspartokinase-like uncharacterized kinase